MTLTPYWAHIEPHVMVLHVLRDGRDIAFSANQSPVNKFYQDMYPSGGGGNADSNRRWQGSGSVGGSNSGGGGGISDDRVKGIRLWSDWNSQVYRWAAEHAQRLRDTYGAGSSSSSSGSSGSSSGSGSAPERTFGYFALHTEELVSTDISVRFAAISDLARWVGSSLSSSLSLSPAVLCCIAQSSAQFMGSHDRTSRDTVRAHNGGDEQREISRRYGKWRAAVRDSPALGLALHAAGKEGLALFGYEQEEAEAEGAAGAGAERSGRSVGSSRDVHRMSAARRFPYGPTGAEAEAEAEGEAGAGFVCAEPTAESERWCAANKDRSQKQQQ